jgi:GAF domain-containing protein
MSAPDSGVLLETLARFAENLTRGYAIGDVLHDLASHVPEVLGVVGAGVTLKPDDRVHFVTAPIEAIAATERLQDEIQSGPCIDAVASARPVTVDDLAADEWVARWPEYTAQARAAGLRAAAGVPMLAAGEVIGAINLYDTRPRTWSSDDLRVAEILASIATSYLLHASALQQQRRTSEQLEQALSTRVIIEQAKGTLAAERGVAVDEAFAMMRKYARDHNKRIHDVADAVVNRGLRP